MALQKHMEFHVRGLLRPILENCRMMVYDETDTNRFLPFLVKINRNQADIKMQSTVLRACLFYNFCIPLNSIDLLEFV